MELPEPTPTETRKPLLVQLCLSLRTWNVAARTAHVIAMSILLGGHVFAVDKHRLYPSLIATVLTGVVLTGLEMGGKAVWLHQGRGLVTLLKLGLIVLVPVFWQYRVPLLVGAATLASVGSHMPARFRYYSVLYRCVIVDPSGPGTAALATRTANNCTEQNPGRQTYQ